MRDVIKGIFKVNRWSRKAKIPVKVKVGIRMPITPARGLSK
jgi:hypothetical protein